MEIASIINLLIPTNPHGLVRVGNDGALEITNTPSAMLNDGVNKIQVMDSSVHNYILNQMSEYYQGQIEAVNSIATTHIKEVGDSAIDALKRVIELEDELEKRKEEYKEALYQNAKYNEWYGQLLSPFAVLRELFRKNIGSHRPLLSKSDWKKHDKEEGANYWLDMFQYWKIIRIEGNTRYFSLISLSETRDFLFTATAREEGKIEIKVRKEFEK